MLPGNMGDVLLNTLKWISEEIPLSPHPVAIE
jgi:hypothetical protein